MNCMVNCMYGHGSLACSWLRCACQGMGQFRASAPTNQRVDNAGYRAKSSREHSAAFFKQRQITYVPGPFGSTAYRLTDDENFSEMDGDIMIPHDSNNTATKGNVCWGPGTDF